MEQKVAHLYKITNNMTGSYYVGKHNGWTQNGYWGSGFAIKGNIAKYGVDNFKYDILCYGSPEYILNLEEKYVTIELIESDKKCLNLMAGGYGCTNVTDITRKKLSEAKKGHIMYRSQERSDKIRKSLIGTKHSEERKEKIRQKALGKKQTSSCKEKRKKAISSLIWINNGEHNLRVTSEMLEKYVQQGYTKGRGKIILKEISNG